MVTSFARRIISRLRSSFSYGVQGASMTRVVWDGDGLVRRALRSITGDPQLGSAVLSQPLIMTNLLKDLLPDSPRESALLVAAAQCDLLEVLQGHLAEGMDLGTAS